MIRQDKRKVSEVTSQKPLQRVDQIRKIEPEKDHPVDKIIKRRSHVVKKKLPGEHEFVIHQIVSFRLLRLIFSIPTDDLFLV